MPLQTGTSDATVATVAALPWRRHPEDGSLCTEGLTGRTYRLRALHPFGAWFILEDPDGTFHLRKSGETETSRHSTQQEAMEAAQAEFEQAILSVVRLVPAEETGKSAMAEDDGT